MYSWKWRLTQNARLVGDDPSAESLPAAHVLCPAGERVSEDISGDGGVLKRVLRSGDGDGLLNALPEDGKAWQVDVEYIGCLLSGEEVDSSRSRGSPFRFLVGRGHVINGWDVGVATMRQGEEAELTIRADYAYGVAGRPPAVPPHATLVFVLELLRVELVSPSIGQPLDDAGFLPLPAPPGTEDQASKEAEDEVHTIEVGGVPVKVDKLGPVVVQTDGSLSRITNWLDMTPNEQQQTLRLIGRRNQQRLNALKAAAEAQI